MGIYTKTGDQGTTALVGGSRIAKTDLQVETYGTIDELNTHISVAEKTASILSNKALLEKIQYQLFFISAEISSPNVQVESKTQQQISNHDIQQLEAAIDQAMNQVPKLHSFVLPGTSLSGSHMHLARSVARRAERRILALNAIKKLRPEILQYFNRLSDVLYALARTEDYENQLTQIVSKVTERYLAINHASAHEKKSNEHATQMALKVLDSALLEAKKINIPIVFSLVDQSGNAILTYRMPQALLVSSELAIKKAYTAVALKMATHELHKNVQPGQDLYQLEASSNGKITSIGGGLPIFSQGKIIGGIGISGGSVEQDIQIANAALKGL